MRSGYRRIDIYEPSSSPSLFIRETSICTRPKTTLSFPDEEDLGFALDLLNPTLLNPFAHHLPPQCFLPPPFPTPTHFDFFDSVTDLIQIDKSPPVTSTSTSTSIYKRLPTQERKGTTDDFFYLKTLCDRVSALETGLDLLVKDNKTKKKTSKELDRKYTWTTEIKSQEKDVADRKYKWIAEIKAGDKNGDEVGEKNYKWIAEIKGKGKDAAASRTYTFKASTAPPPSASASKESCCKSTAKKEEKKKPTKHVVVEIEEPVDHGTVVLKQAFARRAAAANNAKGKKKELSPQDAAMMIQMTFRAYLIRRSQALRALRELAVAKAKLKELRGLFNNFSYRRQILRDGEERQKFSERIIVLLLTVDAIEGADIMVRSARRSMIDELEAMLDVVDPQPPGKLGSMKRRKFDLPECGIQKEIAAGVAEVVHMLDQEERNGGTFEVCL